MHFDSTITAGSLLSAAIVLAVAIAGWVSFRSRADALLASQADLMNHLIRRFEAHEERDSEVFEKMQNRIGDLASGISRLVGQNEVFQRRNERHDREQP